MTRARVSTGMELEYETAGSPDGVPLLMIMGFTAQLTTWPQELVDRLAAGGHYVIRFDNRDCGLSTKLDDQPLHLESFLGAAMSGEAVEVPYTLSDMAADAVGLLDVLGIERAHVMGASMGGMIAQTMAIEHPDRCLSLISVMSMVGDGETGQADPEVMGVLLSPGPTERQAYIDHAPTYMIWQSKKYADAEKAKLDAAAAYDRSFYPAGAPRQLAAITMSGSRAEQLATLDLPTLVIHGRDDRLITPSGGERTAQLIPGANLLMVADMGHDLPVPLIPFIAASVLAHTLTADRQRALASG